MNTFTRKCLHSLSRLSQSIHMAILLRYAYANLPKFNFRGLYKRFDDVRTIKHSKTNDTEPNETKFEYVKFVAGSVRIYVIQFSLVLRFVYLDFGLAIRLFSWR